MEEMLPPPSPEQQESTLEQERITRRTFMMNVGIALNAIVGLAIATPVVAYLLGPATRKRDYRHWIEIGSTTDFQPGETRLITFRNPYTQPWDGETANLPAYVRCSAPGEFTVFAINCAHLGCPVRWFAESQLFMCPCHGGVYYADGSRASGPPERGLFTYDARVEKWQAPDRGRPDAYPQQPRLPRRRSFLPWRDQRPSAASKPRAKDRPMPWYKHTYDWLERRLQLQGPLQQAALHPVPRSTASWWYVFGSASLTLLILQVVTGILLALVYVPSAGQAWNTLQVLNHQLPLGWFLRAMHGWGSNFMVAVVLIHMAQVFLFGAYKFPRELTWILGVFMLLMTLGMAFTGQVLRFDQDSYWGLGIGAAIAGRVPLLGGPLVHLMLGGPIISGATLTRFFALHVFVIPGALLAFTGLHCWLVLTLGVNEWPTPGRVVRRETYIKEYNELAHKDGIPFVPGAVWKDLVFSAAILFAVAFCAAVFGPYGPAGTPDPTIIQTVPKPDFFFLWIYTVLSFLPPSMETPFMLLVPPIALAILIGLPFVAGIGEKSWWRRPVGVFAVMFIAVSWAVFTKLALHTPWSPKMEAWSGAAVPVSYIQGKTPLERQGANVFQAKQCRNCHAIGGVGGERGPGLDSVATRLTEDQLIRQVLLGGGNMPAYGNALSPSETTALVRFLETLHPPNEPAAGDASRRVAESNTVPPNTSVERGNGQQNGIH